MIGLGMSHTRYLSESCDHVRSVRNAYPFLGIEI